MRYIKHLITTNLTLHVPLKTEAQIEDAVKYFTDLIQWAGGGGVKGSRYVRLTISVPSVS
jgi:hypothetical protein